MPKKKLVFNLSPFQACTLIFLIFLLLYGFSASKVPAGYADSDELITTGYVFGVAHPPGYSLVVSSIGLAQRLLGGLNPAHVANLMAALWQSLALGLLASASYMLFRLIEVPIKQWLYIPIGVGIALVGLTAQIWLYGAVIEVHSFNNVLLSATMLCAFWWWFNLKNKKPTQGLFFITIALAAIGISQVQTFILVFPALVIILFLGLKQETDKDIYQKPNTWLAGGGVFLIAFVIPAVVLWLLNSTKSEFSWSFDQTSAGILHMLQRKDYAGYFIDQQTQRNAYWIGFSSHLFTAQPLYIRWLLSQVGYIGGFLAIIGGVWLWVKHRATSIPLWLLFVFTGPFLAGYMQLTENKDAQNLQKVLETAVAERQLLMSQLCIGFFIVAGLYYLFEYTNRYLSTKKTSLIFVVFGLLAVVASVQANAAVGIKRNSTTDVYGRQILEDVDQNAAIICSSDIACYSLFYLSLVEKVRPDVVILAKNSRYRQYFLENHKDYYPHLYVDNPFYLANLVAWNVSKRPTYITNLDSYYIKYLGLNGDPFFVIPEGYVYRISTTKPKEFKKVNTLPTKLLLQQQPSTLDKWQRGLYDYFASLHAFSGRLYTNWGQKDLAEDMFEYSLSLKPDYEEPLVWLLDLADIGVDEQEFVTKEEPVYEEYLKRATEELAAGNREAAYIPALKATYINPQSIEAHELLAKLYGTNTYSEHEQIELEFIKFLKK